MSELRPITIRWWPGMWERIKHYAADTHQPAARAANELLDKTLQEMGYPPVDSSGHGQG